MPPSHAGITQIPVKICGDKHIHGDDEDEDEEEDSAPGVVVSSDSSTEPGQRPPLTAADHGNGNRNPPGNGHKRCKHRPKDLMAAGGVTARPGATPAAGTALGPGGAPLRPGLQPAGRVAGAQGNGGSDGLSTRIEPSGVAKPVVPGAPRPARVCDGAPRPETVTVPFTSGITVTEVRNYNGVEGLIQSVVVEQDGYVTINYSLPGYLLEAYGGNHQQAVAEIESNRVHNRTATGAIPCAQPETAAPGRTRGAFSPTDCTAPLDAYTYRHESVNGITVTTTENYNGVQGLVRSVVVEPDGGTVDDLSFPAWLVDAYGGNLPAIRGDLISGSLRNRRAPWCP